MIKIQVKDPGAKKRKQLSNKYRQMVFRNLGAQLDIIRMTAAKEFIIPNITGFRNPYRAAKAQKTHPTKLTSRTGNLVKMLKNRAKVPGKHWHYGTSTTAARVKSATLRTNAFRGKISVLEGYGGLRETYRAELRIDIDASKMLSDKVGYHMTGHKVSENIMDQSAPDIQFRKQKTLRRETKKTLAMRFKHETGIRGKARPFMRPAAEKEMRNLHSIFNRKLRDIRIL